ncbi:hypothetical protein ACTWPT_54155 [Nonomuraea sp. 3N208]|uniref:hypothetical protein n=1 Tax=Nonomuraea sp. 3N208 TaxID=3457421 RepID=UPI003FD47DAE
MARLRKVVLPGIAFAVLAITGTAVALNASAETETATVQPSFTQPGETTAVPTPTGSRPNVSSAQRLAAEALRGTGLTIPAEWEVVNVRQEQHDDRPVTVIRHQPDVYRLGGPHASLVLDGDGAILGYTRLAEQDDKAILPNAAASEQIALDFLRRVAPKHVSGLRVEWVDQHDEKVTRPDGTTATISGMKVKMQHDSGLYTWVIVGADDSILTYERDINWDSSQGRRGTQMWLHDSWIAAHEGTGPQPGSPYALAQT